MQELPQRYQRNASSDQERRSAHRRSLFADRVVVVALFALSACSEVGSGPDVPAAIEMTALPSPSVVIGDTLRNVEGVATPIQATVRNLEGNVITDAPVYYLYADYPRSNEQGWASEELEAMEAIKRVVRLALHAELNLQSPSD